MFLAPGWVPSVGQICSGTLHGFFELAILTQPGGDIERSVEEEFPVVEAVGSINIETNVFFISSPRIGWCIKVRILFN
jgi:hypothetical protein